MSRTELSNPQSPRHLACAVLCVVLAALSRTDADSASLPNNDSRVSEMGQDDALAQSSLHTEQRYGAERGVE